MSSGNAYADRRRELGARHGFESKMLAAGMAAARSAGDCCRSGCGPKSSAVPNQIRAMIAADLVSAHQLWAEAEAIEIAEGDRPEELVRYLARNPGLSTVATDEQTT